jgi:hypothetical protein
MVSSDSEFGNPEGKFEEHGFRILLGKKNWSQLTI